MKNLKVVLVFCLLLNCKTDYKKEIKDYNIDPVQEKIIDASKAEEKDLINNKSIAIEIKQKKLINKKDERIDLETLIKEKTFFKEKENYTINFTYPELNEKLNPKYENFNNYIKDFYLNISGTEASILEKKQKCDSITLKNFKESRLINYKIYSVNNNLVSVVFYKENFYSGTLHPSFSFNCMNFDLNRGVFMTYKDFFLNDSETDFTNILNREIFSKINKGELYYDCWELSLDNFLNHKNNFVLNETYVEYYFDDCVMCPSYTGSYSVKIPLVKLLSVLKKHEFNPLEF
ncbi:hypothetical protein CLV86_0058 [Lacinutrix venerupis]|uniref:DUF3298 domain-containing protein n=1 Tax=Lacinutrix venerupis TaxID=1486034 RepID=UPI000EAD0E2C|nr:DUF3298 domain-containing protein [Lacinutrix venerupis]RLJ68670.1 hypothetical protein CLV86_0058 [Lacinutrix venerupis]